MVADCFTCARCQCCMHVQEQPPCNHRLIELLLQCNNGGIQPGLTSKTTGTFFAIHVAAVKARRAASNGSSLRTLSIFNARTVWAVSGHLSLVSSQRRQNGESKRTIIYTRLVPLGLSSGGQSAPIACGPHRFVLCQNCASPRKTYEHHMVHHGGRDMTIKIYLIEAARDAHLQIAGGPRVPASDDGNLQRLQMANAATFWSPLLAVSSMNATI